MKMNIIIMIFSFLIINNCLYSQSKVNVKYFTQNEYINNDTIKHLPIQLDLFQHSYNKTIMNQYSIGSWIGDTIKIELNGEQGIQGVQGETGPQGIQGEPGIVDYNLVLAYSIAL